MMGSEAESAPMDMNGAADDSGEGASKGPAGRRRAPRMQLLRDLEFASPGQKNAFLAAQSTMPTMSNQATRGDGKTTAAGAWGVGRAGGLK